MIQVALRPVGYDRGIGHPRLSLGARARGREAVDWERTALSW